MQNLLFPLGQRYRAWREARQAQLRYAEALSFLETLSRRDQLDAGLRPADFPRIAGRMARR